MNFDIDLHNWKHEWRSDHRAGNINRVEERLHERLGKFDVAFHRINHELGKRNNHDYDHWVNCAGHIYVYHTFCPFMFH